MTDKELKKLSRLKLLELLLEQSKENEQLRQDNEAYRQENELLQSQPASPAAVDPAMFTGFSEFAARIDSSLSETRRATQSYIDRLAFLAESAEKSVARASASAKKAEAARLKVTDEAVLPEVEEVTATSITVKPLAKSRPVKKVETKATEATLQATAPSEAAERKTATVPSGPEVPPMPQPTYMPVTGYPVMGAPMYQPVPVYYPAPMPAPVVSVPKAPSRQADRREENGVTVRHLPKKKKAEEPSFEENEDSKLISALVEFYFNNADMLEGLPEEIKKQITIRFKR